jgi:hypothetical protein
VRELGYKNMTNAYECIGIFHSIILLLHGDSGDQSGKEQEVYYSVQSLCEEKTSSSLTWRKRVSQTMMTQMILEMEPLSSFVAKKFSSWGGCK